MANHGVTRVGTLKMVFFEILYHLLILDLLLFYLVRGTYSFVACA